jgi:hypothetical protein
VYSKSFNMFCFIDISPTCPITFTCLLLDPYSFIVLAYHLILTASLSCFLLLHLSLSVLGSSPASARTKVPALQRPCSSDP